MAEGKKKKTLFDVVKPLLLIVNFLCGFSLGNQKPPGRAKRLRKVLQKCFAFLPFLYFAHFYYVHKLSYREIAFNFRWMSVIVIFCCSFYLFAFNEQEMERLVFQLKGFAIGEKSLRATSRMTTVGLCTMALLLTPGLTDIHMLLPHMSEKFIFFTLIFRKSFYKRLRDPFFVFCFIALCFVLLMLAVLVALAFSAFLFPIFISFLCCVLVTYCPSRLDDHVEDIRRVHSPLRRARLISRLCHAYYRLQQLASMTNRNTSKAMSMFKVLTLFLWAVCCHLIKSGSMGFMFNLPFLQCSIPLFVYSVVAPSANNMRCKVFQAAIEVLVADDEWQGHDPLSRSLLTKMRLNLLKHLVHIRMDKGPFTLNGVSVDPETLITTVVEINDMRTVL